MREFERTGIYPEYLMFHSVSLSRSWRIRLREEEQQGVLRMNRKAVFEYFFDGNFGKIRKISTSGRPSPWNEIDAVRMEMRD